jgi:hypothetical protein
MIKPKYISEKLITLFLSFLATLGLNIDLSIDISLENFLIEGYSISRYEQVTGYLSKSMEIIATFFASFQGNSVLWFGIFIAIFLLFDHSFKIKDIKLKRYSIITSLIFSLMYLVGFSINKYDSLITFGGFGIVKNCISFFGITLLFYSLLLQLFDKILSFNINDIPSMSFIIFDSSKRSFIIRSGLIFICYVPYLIVFLPGFFPPDTNYQVNQSFGYIFLSNHHPLFTTAIFSIFIKFGLFLGSANLGLLSFSFFQMLIMAFSFSYVIQYMNKKGVHFYIQALSLLYFMFYSPHAFYSITMWKDTIFGIVFMLLTIQTIQLVDNINIYLKNKNNIVVYGLLCSALFLTRHNGFYILLLFLPILFIFYRQYYKYLLMILSCIIIFYVIIQVFSSVYNIKKGAIGEALSLPLQQITRVVVDNEKQLSHKDKELIGKLLVFDRLTELYNPQISDPIKSPSVFNEKVFKDNKIKYFGLWIKLLFKYPKAYIEAFLCHTLGYWFPDINYWVVLRDICDNHYNIHYYRIVPNFVDNAFAGIFVFRVFPAISMLISIGFAVWVTVILTLIFILKKSYKYLLVIFLIFLLWLSCLASPVSGQFRYIYGLFLVLPVLFSVALSPTFHPTPSERTEQ